MMLDSLLFERVPTGMSYVELMGGTLSVLSTEGVGSKFCIQLDSGVKTQLTVGQPRLIEEQFMNVIDEAQKFFDVDWVNTTERKHYDD